MSKRFTETNKWDDAWFSNLKPLEKLVFLFMIDRCDNAGFFELNPRNHAFQIGISQDEYLGAIKGLNRGLLSSVDNSKIWIKKFLFHQKNLPLNIKNNAHKQIILIIQNNINDFEFDFNSLGADMGLISPIGKGIGKGNSIGKEGGAGETVKLPLEYKTRIGASIQDTISPSEYIQKNHRMYYENCIVGKKLNIEAVHADFDTHSYKPFNNESHFLNTFKSTVSKQIQLQYGTDNGNFKRTNKLQSVGTGGAKDFNDGHSVGS